MSDLHRMKRFLSLKYDLKFCGKVISFSFIACQVKKEQLRTSFLIMGNEPAMSRPSRQHESAILIYGWGARASRKTPAWLLSTMSWMTKNAQKIHSRNPVLLSDLLGNFWTSKSQCFTFLSFVPALPEDTAGVAEGLKWKGEIKYILLLILTEY